MDYVSTTYYTVLSYISSLILSNRKLKDSGQADPDSTEVPQLLTLSDEVRRLPSVKLQAKIKSTTLLLGTSGELRVGVTLANNTVELHSLRIDENDSEGRCMHNILLRKGKSSQFHYFLFIYLSN